MFQLLSQAFYNLKMFLMMDMLGVGDAININTNKNTDKIKMLIDFMLKDINDTKECALELSRLIGGMNAYVNLIPYNETENIGFKRSEKVKILEFYDILKKNGINVTIRREFGGLVSAACGQLRSHG